MRILAITVWAIMVLIVSCCPPVIERDHTSKVDTLIDRITKDSLKLVLPANISYVRDTIRVKDTIIVNDKVIAYVDTVITVYRNNKLYKDSLKLWFDELQKKFRIDYVQPYDTTYRYVVTNTEKTVVQKSQPWYENYLYLILIFFFLLMIAVAIYLLRR